MSKKWGELQIVNICDHIITTNFDKTFENACKKHAAISGKKAELNIQVLPSFNIKELSKRWSITYIHGNLDGGDIILKTREYDKYYPSVSEGNGSTCLEEFIKTIYLDYTIVFIGFSFEDKYFRKLLEIIHSKIKEEEMFNAKDPKFRSRLKNIRHFCFLKNPCEKNIDELHDSMRVLNKRSKKAKEIIKEITAIEDASKMDNNLRNLGIEVYRYKEHSDVIKFLEKIGNQKKAVIGAIPQ